jgi:hypothetical protein
MAEEKRRETINTLMPKAVQDKLAAETDPVAAPRLPSGVEDSRLSHEALLAREQEWRVWYIGKLKRQGYTQKNAEMLADYHIRAKRKEFGLEARTRMEQAERSYDKSVGQAEPDMLIAEEARALEEEADMLHSASGPVIDEIRRKRLEREQQEEKEREQLLAEKEAVAALGRGLQSEPPGTPPAPPAPPPPEAQPAKPIPPIETLAEAVVAGLDTVRLPAGAAAAAAAVATAATETADDMVRDVLWAARNMHREGVKEREAPSQVAWSLWKYAHDYPKPFLEGMFVKAMGLQAKQREVGDEEQRCRMQLSEVERIIAQYSTGDG